MDLEIPLPLPDDRASFPRPRGVYFDCNSTTPLIAPAAQAAIAALTTRYANPSSVHWEGCLAMEMRETARRRVATLMACDPGDVVFTSGATESIHTAIFSALWHAAEQLRRGSGTPEERKVLWYGATEHKVVPEALKHWVKILNLPFEVKALSVDRRGHYDLDLLRSEMDKAFLVCTMAVNNETGVIQQLDALGEMFLKSKNCPLWLVDGVQALGKVDIDFRNLPISYLAFSGHKLHAPKGIGLLLVRPGVPYHPLFVGGGQEQGRRSGTEPLPALAGLSEVIRVLLEERPSVQGASAGTPLSLPLRPLNPLFSDHAQLEGFRTRITQALDAAFPGFSLNVSPESCVPTTLNFSVEGMSGVEIWLLLESHGVFVSSGSACQSSKQGFSHVLEAMGLETWRLASATRLSLGLTFGDAEVDEGCRRIAIAGQALRRSFGKAQSMVRISNGPHTAVLIFDQEREHVVAVGALSELKLRTETVFAEVARSTGKPLEVAQRWTCTEGPDWKTEGNSALDGWSFEALAPGVLVCTPTSLDSKASDANTSQAQSLSQGLGGFVLFARRQGVSPETLARLKPGACYVGVCCSEEGETSGGFPFVIRGGQILTVADVNSGVSSGLEPKEESVELSLEALKEMAPKARFIDVREHYERVEDSPFVDVPAAVGPLLGLSQKVEHVPLSEFLKFLMDEAVSPSGKEQPVIMMCRSGKRGFNAAALLRILGWKNTYNLKGGAATVQTALQAAPPTPFL